MRGAVMVLTVFTGALVAVVIILGIALTRQQAEIQRLQQPVPPQQQQAPAQSPGWDSFTGLNWDALAVTR